MGLDITFYNGKDQSYGLTVPFGIDGFQELVRTGLFKLPHCSADDGARAIDLRIFKVRVTTMVEGLKIPHPQRREILKAITEFKYLTSA